LPSRPGPEQGLPGKEEKGKALFICKNEKEEGKKGCQSFPLRSSPRRGLTADMPFGSRAGGEEKDHRRLCRPSVRTAERRGKRGEKSSCHGRLDKESRGFLSAPSRCVSKMATRGEKGGKGPSLPGERNVPPEVGKRGGRKKKMQSISFNFMGGQ